MKKRITSILLALVLCLGLLPASVLADAADVQWAGAMNYNDANNLVTATASVTAPENTELKWQYQLGTVANFGAYYAGQSVIIGEYLYATGGGKLHKIALDDGVGTVINESAGSTGNYYDYLCYADGKLLVATQTKISAYGLDGSLLGSVEGSFGFYHPVQYHSGYVFCNGNIFSLSSEGKFTCVGEGTIGGDTFNWSSGVFANGLFYVAAKTKIYAVDYTTNTVTDSFEFDASRTATSNTQGGVAYDSGTKRLYWGTYTYNTDIHSIALNDQGKFDTESHLHADAGQKSVCTPVVSGGRVYLAGQSGNISVLNADDLSLIYSAPTGATKIQSNPILSTAGDAVRVYVQGYDGNLYVMQDNNKSGAVTKLAERLNPSGVQFPNAYEQIAMDTQGNVYCYNESGFLFCYGPSACEVPQITTDLSTAEVKYGLNAAAAALTVSAEVSDGGELSYQWQSGTDGLTWNDIPDATAASYTPQTKTTANTYYRCVVTNTKETNHAVAYSSAAYIVTKVLGTDTGLSVFTSTGSNIATGDPVEIQPTDNHYDVLNIGTKRVWLGATDSFASVSVSLVGGNAKQDIGNATSSNVLNGITYTKRFVKSGFVGTELFKITVTAEDGVTTKDYTLTISSKEAADTAFTAYVTLADSGALVADKNGNTVAQTAVTVTDCDHDGAITVDDVLYAAHESLYDGDAAAGYASSAGQYGLSINKLWGDESGCFGYYANDNSCWSLSDTVMDGDYVTAFIYKDKIGWSDAYSFFTNPTAAATAGASVTLTLKSSGYDENWNTVSIPCAGAKIRILGSNNSVLQPQTTDENGCVSLTFTANGSYCVEAYKDDCSIVPAVCKITVTGAAQPTPPAQGDRVYFTLKGDTVHSGRLHVGTSYPTWIGKTAVDYTKGMTVGEVFKAVLDANANCSYNASELAAGYIRSITYRGTELSEFTNGANSGWMYTVNGEHPLVGLNDCVLSAYDVIVFHYTDDYTQEQGSEQWSGGDSKEKKEETTTASLAPEVTAKNGVAAASVDSKAVSDAIAAAKADGAKEIVIAPVVKGSAGKVSVELPKTAVNDIVESSDAALNIQTDVGSIDIPNDTLSEILKAAGSTDIAMSVEKVNPTAVKDSLPAGAKLENAVAVEFSISSGDKTIASFGGKALKVSVPVDAKKFADGKTCTAFVVSADGKVESTTAKIVGGKAVVEMHHFSTVVVTDQVVSVTFTDVAAGAYYYDAVQWAAANGVTSGTDANHFSPDAPCTRGQMVTFLWRAAGCPKVNDKTPFTDVAADTYYSDAVAWAYEQNITGGTSATTFSPNTAVTRAQVVTFLYRYEKPAAGTAVNPFADVQKNAYYYDAVQWAYADGVTDGTDETHFSPNTVCTRGQIVTFLYRDFDSELSESSGVEMRLAEAAAYVLKTTPAPRFGSVGGEWAVLGLARSGSAVPESYYADYYTALEKTVSEAKGVLSTRKYTEYSRVIVALAAIGIDARNVAGYDLTVPLGDYDNTVKQGTSGPVWALIALDSRNYPMPICPDAATGATRQMYIDRLLATQNTDGGWGIGAESASDVDMTAMALQALAKYQEQKAVAAAAERALAFLETAPRVSSESTAQVITALCELGNPVPDELTEELIAYRVSGGGYRHTRDGEVNQMASEQALYALAAVQRAQTGMPGLYRMEQ